MERRSEGGEKEPDPLIGVTGSLLQRTLVCGAQTSLLLSAVVLQTRLKRKSTEVRKASCWDYMSDMVGYEREMEETPEGGLSLLKLFKRT